MKNTIFRQRALIAGAVALATITTISSFTQRNFPKPADDLEGTISISGAFALYPITVKWADEFKKDSSKC